MVCLAQLTSNFGIPIGHCFDESKNTTRHMLRTRIIIKVPIVTTVS
ncbi:hypothetical protein DFA_04233 [Cavenderia fasciculata]|uniref:Uncharacterized protein n=1 Tax=Cavenderia fasciculata TaxID=261658 RepID=F4PV99_CACFS|nr:uncharacterized protein DFA_04233 [Cavenderia fasciculata]EGG20462.1 hypothetical protein DFA_04233 [Cavenderia fasciculata]|eukprot:XP_004358230.1 hypothetical protein DFA_04233 [Cavenderia fasciculata]